MRDWRNSAKAQMQAHGTKTWEENMPALLENMPALLERYKYWLILIKELIMKKIFIKILLKILKILNFLTEKWLKLKDNKEEEWWEEKWENRQDIQDYHTNNLSH